MKSNVRTLMADYKWESAMSKKSNELMAEINNNLITFAKIKKIIVIIEQKR